MRTIVYHSECADACQHDSDPSDPSDVYRIHDQFAAIYSISACRFESWSCDHQCLLNEGANVTHERKQEAFEHRAREPGEVQSKSATSSIVKA